MAGRKCRWREENWPLTLEQEESRFQQNIFENDLFQKTTPDEPLHEINIFNTGLPDSTDKICRKNNLFPINCFENIYNVNDSNDFYQFEPPSTSFSLYQCQVSSNGMQFNSMNKDFQLQSSVLERNLNKYNFQNTILQNLEKEWDSRNVLQSYSKRKRDDDEDIINLSNKIFIPQENSLNVNTFKETRKITVLPERINSSQESSLFPGTFGDMLQLYQSDNRFREMTFNSTNRALEFPLNPFQNDFHENSNSWQKTVASSLKQEWNSQDMFGPYVKKRKLNEDVNLNQKFSYQDSSDNSIAMNPFEYQKNVSAYPLYLPEKINVMQQPQFIESEIKNNFHTDTIDIPNTFANGIEYVPSNKFHKNFVRGTAEIDLLEKTTAKFGNFENNLMKSDVIAELNRLRSGLSYKIEYESDLSACKPVFMVSVEIDGRKYIGVGCSKESAKVEAATMALKKMSYTFDNYLKDKFLRCIPDRKENNIHYDNRNDTDKKRKEEKDNTDFHYKCREDPVVLLNSIVSNIHFRCREVINTRNFSLFKMVVHVNDQRFEGSGRSKKLAKIAAAKAALAFLGISYSPMTQCKRMNEIECLELSQSHADIVAKLVNRKFETIVKDKNIRYKRKVLSGIVMTKNMNFDEAMVICVSTGTKCLSGENINPNGTVLNDCHAEIISRRCLLNFFYSELEKHFDPLSAEKSILEKNPINANFPYKLRDEVQFHLYISTAPCGDAVILSSHSNTTKRGQLRYKVEATQGTIVVSKSDTAQTWDGVLKGELLRTMSCSDKIARWNILGVQGALLAKLIGPIYLHSVVLGSLLYPESMYRAVCGRIQKSIENLPLPYILNKPHLAMITSVESRNLALPPNKSINWTVCDNKIEIVNPRTGKTTDNHVSRLAKASFFKRYLNLLKKLPNISQKNMGFDYGETKSSVQDYQVAKKKLFKAFQNQNLGVWLKKPKEQDEFFLRSN